MPDVKKKKKDRKEHWNSSWDSEKWRDLIELIKKDVSQKDACAYVWLPTSTLHDWLNRDKKLSEEYDRAEKWMDITTSDVLVNWITDEELDKRERMKYALEWKKRRDRRYKDKAEVENTEVKRFKLDDLYDEEN